MKVHAKFYLFSIVCLFITLNLCGCANEYEAKKIAYFKEHPYAIAPAMLECIRKDSRGEKIARDPDCLAVFHYEKQICELKQREGALMYVGYNCHNNVDLAKLALSGL